MRELEIARWKDVLKDRPTRFRSGRKDREAAVMVPLIEREGEWFVLFEVRSRKLKAQPGEICFPGGRMDDGEYPKETAIRETCEELLVEKSQIEVLGGIDGTLGPGGAPVWAFAGILHDYQETFSADEVGTVFCVPLQELEMMKPESGIVYQKTIPADDFPVHLIRNKEEYHWAESEKEIFFYQWNEYTIWGMTARVLYNFLQIFHPETSSEKMAD